jgi:signal transduction histidine kinase/CheY-like chemotaxis protein
VASAPKGELIYANKAFGDILGMGARSDVAAGEYAAAYSILRRGAGPYPEAELPFVRAMLGKTTVMVDDLVVRRPDGTEVDVRAFAQPMFGPDGEVESVSVSFIDITREIAAERDRKRSDALLRQVINSAPIILFSYDANAIVTLSEGRGLQAIGVKPGQLVGVSVLELTRGDPLNLDNARRALAGEAFASRSRYSGAMLETTFAPLLDAHGQPAGTVGVSLDITEQERANRQLQISDRMAAVGTLAAGVAHEINNPLTFVMASLELAERQQGMPDAARTHLAAAREGISRVARIARDLFTFSRDAGDRRSPVKLKAVVEAAVRLSSSQTQQVADVSESHGPAVLVLADEGRLAQVLLNLLINAGHAIEAAGKKRGSIRIATGVAADGRAQVSVEDDGGGIAPELLPHVFDPFVTTKPAGMGTGLGLSVSKSIVESYGGELTVTSEVGKGSTFLVRLPAAPKSTVETPSRPVLASIAPARARVLLIDDDANLCTAFRAVLQPDHEVTVCMRGDEALKLLLGDREFDVVLCDVMLREIQAKAIYDAVKAEKPGKERELVFITGGAYLKEAREFLAAVPNLRFEKPFQVDEVVAEVLRRRRVR